MLRFFTSFLLLLFIGSVSFLGAQNGVLISDEAGDPHPSAVLDLDASDRGFLTPRMSTAQRDAIVDPADGLLIFNISRGYFNYYDAFTDEWYDLQPSRERRMVDTTQTLYLSGANFHPASNAQDYSSNFGQGGAYFTSGFNRAIAPLPLPAGTRITSITAYYRDNSTTSELSIGLDMEMLTAGLFDSAGDLATGVATASDTWTSGTIDLDGGSYVLLEDRGYFIDVFSNSWNSDMRIKGVKIVYTLPTTTN